MRNILNFLTTLLFTATTLATTYIIASICSIESIRDAFNLANGEMLIKYAALVVCAGLGILLLNILYWIAETREQKDRS